MRRKSVADLLLEAFSKRILDHTWREGKVLPSVRTLTGLFGVARATMDIAVREAVRQGLFATEARRCTRVAAGAVGHAERLLNQFRSSRRGARIAILMPDSRREGYCDAHHKAIVQAVGEQAARRGWVAEPIFWPLGPQTGFPRLLVERRFDGAFCIMTRPERLMPLYFMRQRNFPLVVYNRRLFDLPLPAVMFDDYAAVQQLGRLLYGMGHRRICLLSGPAEAEDFFTSRQITGWLDFCCQNDLLARWDEPIYLLCHPDPVCALRAYFRKRPLPTAVIFGSGLFLDAFLRLGDVGVKVPEDISLAAGQCFPEDFAGGDPSPITCMRPNLRRMAECAVELLGRMVDGEPYPPPIRLPYTLVRSDSVGPPPHE